MEMLNVQYQVHPEAFATEVDDQVVILEYESGTYFTLNEVGSRIWQLLTQGNTVQTIQNQLLQEYEVSEAQLHQDLLNILNELRAKGLIS